MKLNNFLGFLNVVLVAIFVIVQMAASHPVGSSYEMIENMREIPQWHCLRYRKFDLVKRCRHYRIGYKS